ncbi:MAG: polynucleotide kinase-phosphatase [Acidimicrobiales bacterium]|nr:polynucleotide kinase-phosphatase [Acidimicrobiales bacterium]
MTATTITIPDLALVVLIGPSGAGKSSFAARHFAPSEVLSSDFCRLLVADDENDQAATPAAFDVLGYIAGKRLEAGRLTVVDATSVQRDARAPLVRLAREHHVLPVAIVLDVPEKVCAERNAARPDRNLPAHAMRRQHQQLRKSIKGLQREGFRRVFVLKGTEEIDAVSIERERRWTDRRDDHGPFDFIGDVHGCADELVALLTELGYDVAPDRSTASHPAGRKAFFVGDLVDRGPDSPGVLRLAMGMVRDGTGACIPGNHENKLWRALNGRNVQVSHGLAETLAQLEDEPEEFRTEVATFIDSLVSHAVLDDGRCVVAHAGLPERLHNRSSGAVRSFALYGDTTGETDEFGLPVRYPWANDYRGSAIVVYGHTPVPEAEWINNTICIDTGCVFGGKLTALRYPERELVSVPAARTYWEPTKPLHPATTEAERPAELLDATDVLGKRIVDTRLQPRITVGAENAAAAFEVMSRWAIDPRWLIYLPPTMAPTATSARPDILEHPTEAFAAYRRDGIAQVICEEKHMGSRAVVIVCRDAEVAARRFKIDDPAGGTVYTRTGRAFFTDPAWQAKVIERTRAAISAAELWDALDTDWLALDTELLPWSAKAEDLLRSQYAAVGAAGHAMTTRASELLATALHRGVDVTDLAHRTEERVLAVDRFVDAYRQYCWSVEEPDDLQIAPFVVLAAEGTLLAERDHTWHMSIAERLVATGDGFIRPTRNLTVDLDDPESAAAAVTWWEQLVGDGGEGMVVKPLESIVTGTRGLIQPGIKCRGPEYLRIIYGPEYLVPQNLERLRERSLGKKRSLAQREFALGIEALERFVAGDPLHRVHECVFGVLAMESEPVDPRL